MKILARASFVLAITLSASIQVEAQFIKKLKNAASQGMENAIEKKVEEEAERMMRNQLEKQLTQLYGENGQGNPVDFDMDKILAGLGEEVATEDTYSFIGYVNLELRSIDKNGKEIDPVYMKSFLGESKSYTAMAITDPKNPQMTTNMIFDTKNKASILLMENEGNKSSFAYKLDFDELMTDSTGMGELELEAADYSITKTGNSKEIAGYDCEEYHVKSKDGEGNYWITTEPIAGTNSFWSSNSPFASQKMQKNYEDIFSHMPKGNFMEMDFKSTDGSEVKMKVIDIQASAAQVFTMSEYPNMMQGMKQ